MKDFLSSVLQGLSPDLVTELWLDHEFTQNIRALPLEYISGLEPFQMLEKLSLSGHSLVEIPPFPSLMRLGYLDLSHNQIAQIEGLGTLPHLTYLDLSYNEIEQIDVLQFLSELEHLNLSHNYLKDLTPLETLSHLKWLSLSGLAHRAIQSLAPLSSLHNLEVLFARHLRIGDYRPILKLPSLYALSVSPLNKEALKDLSQISRLRQLSLGGKFLAGKLSLPPLPHLQQLRISKGEIFDIEGWDHVSSLRELELSFLHLSTFPPLSKMPQIKKMILHHNQISQIPITELGNVTYLDVRENPIHPVLLQEIRQTYPDLELLSGKRGG
ncbi:MAG: leucine-rich repeat domain-containing protein [Bacteroidota bacterium]